jgi:hypothetical protein
MNRIARTCLFLLVAVSWPSQTSAEIVPFDGPTAKSSWYQMFIESGVGPFDHLQFYMLPTDAWKQPTGIIPFNMNWTQTWNDGTYLIADGNDVGTLLFALGFAGDRPEPLSFLFQAWDDDTVRETTMATWTGQHWEFQPATWNTPRLTPEPATVVLLAAGASGCTAAIRLRRAER